MDSLHIGPAMRSFDIFLFISLNKLTIRFIGWFQTPWHSNDVTVILTMVCRHLQNQAIITDSWHCPSSTSQWDLNSFLRTELYWYGDRNSMTMTKLGTGIHRRGAHGGKMKFTTLRSDMVQNFFICVNFHSPKVIWSVSAWLIINQRSPNKNVVILTKLVNLITWLMQWWRKRLTRYFRHSGNVCSWSSIRS